MKKAIYMIKLLKYQQKIFFFIFLVLSYLTKRASNFL